MNNKEYGGKTVFHTTLFEALGHSILHNFFEL